eukprot:scaffold194500_cov19-Tisochrysis_lutea.AAC.1
MVVGRPCDGGSALIRSLGTLQWQDAGFCLGGMVRLQWGLGGMLEKVKCTRRAEYAPSYSTCGQGPAMPWWHSVPDEV